jgi:hypothetical protein
MPNQRRIDRGIVLMEKVKLSSRIDDPHQKFYYTFNFDRPFDFHIELLKILLDETPGTNYPAVTKSSGEAPKQFGNVFNPTTLPPVNEDFDFLNEMEYTPEDAEEGFSEVLDTEDELEVEEHHESEESEEEDEFGNEFSDNEGFEDEGHRQHNDDY